MVLNWVNVESGNCWLKLIYNFILYDTERSLLPFGGTVSDSYRGKWLSVCCENYTDRTEPICVQNVMICRNVTIYKTVKYHRHVTADHRRVNQVSNLLDLTEYTTCSIRKTTLLICSVHTSQKTQCAWITETIQLIFYGEQSTMYCIDRIEYTNTQCGQHANP